MLKVKDGEIGLEALNSTEYEYLIYVHNPLGGASIYLTREELERFQKSIEVELQSKQSKNDTASIKTFWNPLNPFGQP